MDEQSMEHIVEIPEEEVMSFNTGEQIKQYFIKNVQARFKFSGWVSGKKQHYYARCCLCPYYISWSRHIDESSEKFQLVSYTRIHAHKEEEMKSRQLSKQKKGRKRRKIINEVNVTLEQSDLKDQKLILKQVFGYLAKNQINYEDSGEPSRIAKKLCEQYKISREFGERLVNLYLKCRKKEESLRMKRDLMNLVDSKPTNPHFENIFQNSDDFSESEFFSESKNPQSEEQQINVKEKVKEYLSNICPKK